SGAPNWRFNGAAPARARKEANGIEEVSSPLELQWGRARAGAERDELFRSQLLLAALQWGRARAGAERLGWLVWLLLWLHASMGPRPRGRGKRTFQLLFQRRTFASMGPRPRGRGKSTLPIHPSRGLSPLQWG